MLYYAYIFVIWPMGFIVIWLFGLKEIWLFDLCYVINLYKSYGYFGNTWLYCNIILDILFYGYMVILSMGDMLWSMACMVLWLYGLMAFETR